jgi:hypothetical protein
LDVHQKTITACVRIASKRKVLRETRTFGTATAELLELVDWLEEHGCTHIAMEATRVYWKPTWHVLEGHFELVLAHPAQVKNMPRRKSDVSDAAWICDLLAHGLIRASFVPPAPIQELRPIGRERRRRESCVGAAGRATRNSKRHSGQKARAKPDYGHLAQQVVAGLDRSPVRRFGRSRMARPRLIVDHYALSDFHALLIQNRLNCTGEQALFTLIE